MRCATLQGGQSVQLQQGSAHLAVSTHNVWAIGSDIELIRLQNTNAAYERLFKADVKDCFVINMASPKEEGAA